ncbi:hypothetical protein V1478_012147 [Vespula squamosa]|uniref:Uncharacterized protein n=1 Tax=Vespula squamosa TaxID=30214 RepID=A0ABD2ACD8_VESSQ
MVFRIKGSKTTARDVVDAGEWQTRRVSQSSAFVSYKLTRIFLFLGTLDHFDVEMEKRIFFVSGETTSKKKRKDRSESKGLEFCLVQTRNPSFDFFFLSRVTRMQSTTWEPSASVKLHACPAYQYECEATTYTVISYSHFTRKTVKLIENGNILFRVVHSSVSALSNFRQNSLDWYWLSRYTSLTTHSASPNKTRKFYLRSVKLSGKSSNASLLTPFGRQKHHQIFIDRVDVEPAAVASSIATTTTMKESSRHRRETLFLQASNGYRSILGAFSTLKSCEGMRSPRENSEGKAGYRCRLRWLVTWNDAWVAIGRMQIENQYPLRLYR